MRLTMLLVGTGALIAGIYSGTHEVESSATADWGGQVQATCGSAFDPYPSRQFFPELAAACNTAISPWLPLAIALLFIAAIVLVRFLYMLIGPKTSER